MCIIIHYTNIFFLPGRAVSRVGSLKSWSLYIRLPGEAFKNTQLHEGSLLEILLQSVRRGRTWY